MQNNIDVSLAVESCRVCPRQCGSLRQERKGFCREGLQMRLAWAGLHFGEEPPITAVGGSGAVFLTGCNLRCSFCQNVAISQEGMGREVSLSKFADICLALQDKGAENINIVTGSHAAAMVRAALLEAKRKGLDIPICWNSSAFERTEAIDLLADVVDIWLPDLKTLDLAISRSAFAAPEYPQMAKKAIERMAEISPLRYATVHDAEGNPVQKMLGGVIVRHLILPGRTDSSLAVLEWFAKHLQGKALLSVMSQYTPMDKSKSFAVFENRFVSEDENNRVLDTWEEFGDVDGFFQELITGDEWLPDFSKQLPFDNNLAKTVWHWKSGLIQS